MKSIGIIGFGNMGEAFAAGLRKNMTNLSINVYEPVRIKTERAREMYKASLCSSLAELFKESEICIVAVKPQNLDDLIANSGNHAEGKKIISIAAGVSIRHLKDKLRTEHVIRFMPNIAAMEGKAFIGVSYHGSPAKEFLENALHIADSIGTSLVVPETLVPAVTGLSGSGIAFVFAFIHALSLGGTKCGIPYNDAVSIAVSTLEGAAALINSSKEHPEVLLNRVTSPAGTTIEGIAQLESGAFTSSVINAVEAATNRALELER